jgi:hypothetical protein
MKTPVTEIKKALENALLNDGVMEQLLYEYEFEEIIPELIETLTADKDDYLYAITTHKNDITGQEDTAMVLIEATGETHINELARAKLQEIWAGAYIRNMKQLIPDYAKQLYAGDLPMNGLKTIA